MLQFRSQVPLRRGHSGSPVFGDDGKLAGILVGRVKGDPRAGRAISVARYRDWIAANLGNRE